MLLTYVCQPGPPVPHRGLSAQLGQVAAVALVGADVLAEEVHRTLALDAPHRALDSVGRAVEAVRAQQLQRAGDAQRRSDRQQVRQGEAGGADAGAELVERRALAAVADQVEWDERLVRQRVARAVRLGQPLAAEAL